METHTAPEARLRPGLDEAPRLKQQPRDLLKPLRGRGVDGRLAQQRVEWRGVRPLLQEPADCLRGPRARGDMEGRPLVLWVGGGKAEQGVS